MENKKITYTPTNLPTNFIKEHERKNYMDGILKAEEHLNSITKASIEEEGLN